MTNPFLFKIFCLVKIPLLAFTNVKVISFSQNKSITKVPFKYLNKNPFKSMYFAVQAMAAELATASQAILAIESCEENIAYIVTACEAEFYKKVNSTLFFECTDYALFQKGVFQAVQTGNGVEVKAVALGKSESGQELARFTFTWSFKKRV